MAEMSWEERRELEEEILYLTRLIESHKQKSKKEGEGIQATRPNPYKLVNPSYAGQSSISKPSEDSCKSAPFRGQSSSSPSTSTVPSKCSTAFRHGATNQCTLQKSSGMRPNPIMKPNSDEKPRSAASPGRVVKPNPGISPRPALKLSPTVEQNAIVKPIATVKFSSAVKPTPAVKPRKRSLSTVVRKSRYKLQKTHVPPGTPGDTPPSIKRVGRSSFGPAAARGHFSRSPRRSSCASKVGAMGRYVYRKSNVSAVTSSPRRSVFATSKLSGRSILPRALVSKYKLVRNKTKAPTPNKSPVANLACLGARRIVKKYKINNVNRTRASLLHSQGQSGRSANPGRRLPWPPSYASTHYFHKLHGNRAGRHHYKKTGTDARDSQSHFIKIGSITYRASRNKLFRTRKHSLSLTPTTPRGSPRQQRVLVIRGTTYHMDISGKVLRRAPASSQSPGASLSRIDIGGKTFVEQLPGVLSQTPSSETRTYLSRTINRSIHGVRTVNTRKLERRSDRFCIFFNRFGRCNKGTSCTYIHDPEKVAVCTRRVTLFERSSAFLRGTCKVSDCPFSHKVAPEKMPVCSFFLKGRCTSNPCPYRHVKVNAKAEVCRDFAVHGFCTEGIKCKRQHILICPEYAANKKCPRGSRCFLAHRDRAAKRKQHHEKPASPVELEERSVPQWQHRDEDAEREEGEGPSRKMARGPLFISLKPYESPLGTPTGRPTQADQKGIRIRPDFLS
ncbi:unnamed protein product [Ixodes hexagonus]